MRLGGLAARVGFGDRAPGAVAGLRWSSIPGPAILISCMPRATPAVCWHWLAYPFLVEPNVGLAMQSRLWRAGFLVLAILILACGLVARGMSRARAARGLALDDDSKTDSGADRTDSGATERLTAMRDVRWILLVFVPSSWLMGVTTYLTTDLAAIPLFWTIPLALYLRASSSLLPDRGQAVVRAAARLLPYIILPLALVMSAGFAHAVVDSASSARFLRGLRGVSRRAGADPARGPACECILRDDRRRRTARGDLHRTGRAGGLQPRDRVSAGDRAGVH